MLVVQDTFVYYHLSILSSFHRNSKSSLIILYGFHIQKFLIYIPGYCNFVIFRSIVEEGHFHHHRVSTGRVLVGDASALLRVLAIFGVYREKGPVTVHNPWMMCEYSQTSIIFSVGHK